MDTQKMILQAKQRAKWNTIIILLTIILSVTPIFYTLSVTYYATNDRANEAIARTTALYALTDPAIKMDSTFVKTKISPLFNLTFEAALQEQYAGENYTVGSYEATYGFMQKTSEQIDMRAPTPTDEKFPKYFTNTDFQHDTKTIQPDQQVTVFALFDKNYTVNELDIFLRRNALVMWNAVNTGVEKQILTSTKETYPLIGYPTTGVVMERNTESAFLKQLELLTELPTQPYDIGAKKRLAYVKKHGISIYGATLSLSGETLNQLLDDHLIRNFVLLRKEL